MPDSTQNTYSGIYQRIPDPAFIWKKSEKQDIIVLAEANEAAYHVTNGGIKRYLGQPIEVVLDHNPEFIRDVKKCMETGRTIRKQRLYRYKSTSRSIWLAVDIIRIHAGIVLVVTRDIDLKVKLTQELEESEKLLRSMFNANPDAHIITSLNGEILQCNQSAVSLMGCPDSRTLQQHWKTSPFSFPDGEIDPVAFMKFKAQVMNVRVMVTRLNGETFPALFSSGRISLHNQSMLYCHLKDITDYEKVCCSLEETSRLHQAIIRQMNDGLIYTNKDDRCKVINPAARNMLNIQDVHFQNEPLIQVLSHPDVNDIGRLFNPEQIRTQAEISDRFTTLLELKSSNNNVTIELLYTRLPNGHLYQLRDISSQKQLELERKNLEKMETTSRIASQIAHDFNNLLNPLITIPDLIQRTLHPDNNVIKLLNLIKISARQMLQINTQLMTLAKRGRMTLHPVRINSLIEKIVFMKMIPSDIYLELTLDSKLPAIMGDDAQLMRVFLNLITNAVEAINPPGMIHIQSRRLRIEDPQKYQVDTQGDYVCITITDTGCGIDTSIREEIFKPFFTTKNGPSKSGLGLGLNISQKVIEDHGGSLQLSSTGQKGSTFTILIPALPSNEPNPLLKDDSRR